MCNIRTLCTVQPHDVSHSFIHSAVSLKHARHAHAQVTRETHHTRCTQAAFLKCGDGFPCSSSARSSLSSSCSSRLTFRSTGAHRLIFCDVTIDDYDGILEEWGQERSMTEFNSSTVLSSTSAPFSPSVYPSSSLSFSPTVISRSLGRQWIQFTRQCLESFGGCDRLGLFMPVDSSSCGLVTRTKS